MNKIINFLTGIIHYVTDLWMKQDISLENNVFLHNELTGWWKSLCMMVDNTHSKSYQ